MSIHAYTEDQLVGQPAAEGVFGANGTQAAHAACPSFSAHERLANTQQLQT